MNTCNKQMVNLSNLREIELRKLENNLMCNVSKEHVSEVINRNMRTNLHVE